MITKTKSKISKGNLVAINLSTGKELEGYWNGKLYENNTVLYINNHKLNVNEYNFSNKASVAKKTKQVKNAICPKCGTYCYGDCSIY